VPWDNGTPPDFGLSRELWIGRRSATSRQWSGTQACHKHQGNQRYAEDKKKYVGQKGNNGSRRPYIRPQSAGSWISRSRGVKPSISIKVPNKQSVKQVIYEGATTKRVVGSSAVGSTQGARYAGYAARWVSGASIAANDREMASDLSRRVASGDRTMPAAVVRRCDDWWEQLQSHNRHRSNGKLR